MFFVKPKLIGEIIGWYGALAILLAFALVSFDIIKSQNIAYQLLNLTGAAGIIYISLIKKAYQPAFLNIVWAIIAVAAIIRILI